MAEIVGFDSRFFDGIYPASHPFKYTFIKCTEGTGFKASNYETQRDAAKSNGLLWAGYHFYRNSVGPEDQAAYFRSEVGAAVGELPPVLDLEDTASVKLGALPSRALRCMQEIERLFGRKPMLYSASWWWNPWMGGGQFWANDYFRWVANYTTAASPLLPSGWSGWDVWQYRGDVLQQGFNAKIDWNRCDSAWLDQFQPANPIPEPPDLTAWLKELRAAHATVGHVIAEFPG